MNQAKDRTGAGDSASQVPSPVPLMQLITGFWGTKTLAAAVELDLFNTLAGGRGMALDEAAAALGLQHRPADLLLAACASLGLLEKRGDRYYNSAIAEEYLVAGSHNPFGGFVRFIDHRQYSAWGNITTALRTNRPVTWDPDTQDSVFSAEDPVMLEMFWEAMHAMSTATAQMLARELDLTPYHRVLDVGGGSAAYDIELCRAYPHLTATCYDLPHVCDIAAAKIEEAGLANRIETVAGDFFSDARLPAGHDVIVLSSILHDWDEATDRALLAKCHEALRDGGVVIISEVILDDDRAGPPEAALMGMNMLAETVGGKNYSGAEYTAWLTDAGFTNVRRLTFTAPGANGAIIGVEEH